jgi:LEA14-like dessication related protein
MALPKNTISTISFIGAIGLLSYAIYSYGKRQYELITSFTYKIVGASIIQISTTNIEFTLDLLFQNNSSLEMTIKSMNLLFYLNGVQAATINQQEPFIIAANSTTLIPANIHVDPTAIINNIMSIINLQEALSDSVFTIQGNVSVKSGFVSAIVPVNYQTTYKQLMNS